MTRRQELERTSELALRIIRDGRNGKTDVESAQFFGDCIQTVTRLHYFITR